MATTTNYGWTTPDDTALVKDGASAIRTLGSSVDTTTKNLNPSTTLGDIEFRSSTANTNTRLGIGTTGQVLLVSGGVPAWGTASSGLTLITAQSFTTAAAVNVNSVFSATYENYKVIIDWRASSGNASLSFRYRVAGADNSTSNYFLVRSGADAGGITENQCHGVSAQLNYLAYGNDTTLSSISIDVLKPFAAKKTTMNGTSVGLTTGFSNVAGHALNSLFDAATSFDGFSIYPSASTVNGVVRIYGYAN